jgi:hypothetical protein
MLNQFSLNCTPLKRRFHPLVHRLEGRLAYRRVGSLGLAGIALACAQFASGEMYLEGNDGDHALSSTHDRYYVGADKAFIGASLDLSGVSSGPPWATMVSPQYFITAYHLAANSQSTLTFHEGNDASSTAHTYDVDSSFHYTTVYDGQPSDVHMGRLVAPIPAADHIAFYPVLSLPSFSDYVGMTIYNYGNPNRLGRNLISRIEPYAEGGENQVGMFFNYDVPGLGADETYLIGGDSGGPSFVIVNGKLALLGEHFSTYGTSGLVPYEGGAPTAGDGTWWSTDHAGVRTRSDEADHLVLGQQRDGCLAAGFGRVCLAAER